MTDAYFLGLELKDLELADSKVLSDFLKRHPQRLTGYTFATLAAWHSHFHYRWALLEGETLLIACKPLDDPHRVHLLQPVGRFPHALAEQVINAASKLPYPLKILAVGASFLEENPDFCRSFTVQEDRALSNYLYSASALAKLSGRKYSKKRNLISQASNLYKWKVENLTVANAGSCFKVLHSINLEEQQPMEGMLRRELEALEFTIRHFSELSQQGLLITINDQPAAFSIYEAINPTTVAVHFERALRSYKGLYQVINQETAKVVLEQGFEFINREEDLGDAGLRDAKMSYHPIEIIPAYELTFQGH